MAGLAPFFRPVYQIMQLQKLVNMFGGDLMRRYGEKVHKLTLHGGFSCPNRDGTIGRGGCTFCNVASFADEEQQHRSIAEQLAHQAQRVNRAKRYLAYFQAYTSTFAEVQVLRQRWRQQGGALLFTDPLRYTVAALQLLCNGQPLHNLKPVLRWLQLLGQPWFGRSTPDGYPLRGDAWLNTGQLTQRVELAREMVASLPTLLGWPDAAARAEHAQTVLDSDRGRALQAWLPPSARAVLQRTRQPHEALALLLASPACMFH